MSEDNSNSGRYALAAAGILIVLYGLFIYVKGSYNVWGLTILEIVGICLIVYSIFAKDEGNSHDYDFIEEEELGEEVVEENEVVEAEEGIIEVDQVDQVDSVDQVDQEENKIVEAEVIKND